MIKYMGWDRQTSLRAGPSENYKFPLTLRMTGSYGSHGSFGTKIYGSLIFVPVLRVLSSRYIFL